MVDSTVKTRSTPFWLAFLGGMPLAITLLTTLAIASVIGTVLQQNQAYQDYLIKFGPFWFEVFKKLQLFDVYSATWFIVILGFLVLSTSICLLRNIPNMLKEMKSHRIDIQEKSLLSLKNNTTLQIKANHSELITVLQRFLKINSYNIKTKNIDENNILLAGRKGNGNRLGYIFSHLAIIIICLGGLLDSNLRLKIKELTGNLLVETRNVNNTAELDEKTWLDTHNPAFRSHVRITEGQKTDFAIINIRDGFVLQKLPFEVELVDFRVEHYSTGQPKSFESDVLIHDPDLAKPIQKTIEVNHPLVHKGYRLFQSDFGDGGTILNFNLWTFLPFQQNPLFIITGPDKQDVKVVNDFAYPLQGEVFNKAVVSTLEEAVAIEFTDFRLFNIQPVQDAAPGEKKVKNFGPSVIFKVRNEAGQAREYESYVNFVEIKNPDTGKRNNFYITGVRDSVAEPYRYLYIPADKDYKIDTFFYFLHALSDQKRIENITTLLSQEILTSFNQTNNPEMQKRMMESMQTILQVFVTGGFDGLTQYIEKNIPQEKQEEISASYARILQGLLLAIYQQVLFEQYNIQVLEEKDYVFLDLAVNSINALSFFGTPFYLHLDTFKHIEASGLQISKAPGQNIVYFGSFLLSLGVFMLFYMRQQRVWLLLRKKEEGLTEVIFAGMANRNQTLFEKDYQNLAAELEKNLPIS